MANEDARDNNVLGGALKIAAAGAMVYGGAKGIGQLTRHYDDLGATFLGKNGKKISSKIDDAISSFSKEDGSNAIRDKLNNQQSKLLEKDHLKAMSNKSKASEVLYGEGFGEDEIKSIHDEFKQRSNADKRSELKTQRGQIKSLNGEVKENKKIAKLAKESDS